VPEADELGRDVVEGVFASVNDQLSEAGHVGIAIDVAPGAADSAEVEYRLQTAHGAIVLKVLNDDCDADIQVLNKEERIVVLPKGANSPTVFSIDDAVQSLNVQLGSGTWSCTHCKLRGRRHKLDARFESAELQNGEGTETTTRSVPTTER
jgi:hypothetical protein